MSNIGPSELLTILGGLVVLLMVGALVFTLVMALRRSGRRR